MKKVYHRTSKYVTPMLVIDGDVDHLVKHIWATSQSLRKKDRINPDFVIIDTETCYLDPGGFMSMKEEFKEFMVEGFSFKVKLSHIEQVLTLMSYGKERCPGYMRFPIWSGWCNCLVILPVGMFHAIKAKLSELMRSSEGLHASLDFNNALEDIRNYQYDKLKKDDK